MLEVPKSVLSFQIISSRKSRHPSMVTPYKWEAEVFVCVKRHRAGAVVAYQVKISPVVIKRNLQGVKQIELTSNNGQSDEFCLIFLEN